jgi:hypothetical protein
LAERSGPFFIPHPTHSYRNTDVTLRLYAAEIHTHPSVTSPKNYPQAEKGEIPGRKEKPRKNGRKNIKMKNKLVDIIYIIIYI